MVYKILVIAHVLGACVWIGGHVVLMAMVMPKALREKDPERVIEFEHGYGRLGLGALVIQLVTGLWLAHRWIGGWSALFDAPTPQARLVLSKLAILIFTVVLAGFTYHRVLPHIRERGLIAFALLSGAAAVLALAMLTLGVGIRTGSLW